VTQGTDRDRALRDAGFMPLMELAEQIKVSRSTVHRWLVNGEIEGQRAYGKNYIRISSVINKMTPEIAKVFGLEEKST
jgi:excisionase family DNA binding protein